MINKFLYLSAFLALLVSGIAEAQTTANAGWGGSDMVTECHERHLDAVAGVFSDSDIEGCLTYPSIVGPTDIDANGATNGFVTVQGEIDVAGPDILTAGLISFTYAHTGFSNCDYGSEGQLDDTTVAGTGSSYHFLIDVRGPYCKGYITLTLSAGAVPVTYARMIWPVDIVPTNTEMDVKDRFCNSSAYNTTCTTPDIDNQNRLCDASAFGTACTVPQIQVDSLTRLCAASSYNTTCTTPTINAAITGSLTATLSGTLDVLDRLCAASATGTSCTTANLNAIISGTLDNLNRICDDSTLGSACNELHFTADLLSRLCNASSYNTTCTAPNINAVLTGTLNTIQSGTLTVHQDPICTAAAHCHVDTNGTGASIGTIMGNFTVQQCSTARLNADPHACDVNVHSPGSMSAPAWDWWLELIFWIAVFYYILRTQNLLMLVFAIGGVIHLVNPSWFFGLDKSIPWMGLGAFLDIIIARRREKKESRT